MSTVSGSRWTYLRSSPLRGLLSILHLKAEKGFKSLELFVQDAVLLGETVDAVVGLPHPPDGAADGVGLEASGHPASGLVNLSQVDLEKAKLKRQIEV